MLTPETIREHLLRVVTMARTCEVDLSTALDAGQISANGYADLVTRCSGCTQSDSCDKLLASTKVLPQAPEYCVNRDTFAQLRDLQAG